MFATIQIDTRTVYGIGETADRARDDAVEHGVSCTCEDGDESCPHVYGALPDGFATVPCTPAAAAYILKFGGAPSVELTVSRSGVCLREEEWMPAPRKRGRPPATGTARGSSILLRVTPEEREELRAAAARDDRPLSAWIRHVALKAARS